MKTTALTATHEALGARMTNFAGYNMPLIYTNLNEEHATVRERVGVFDVSHMGEFIVRGRQALDLVQAISSNDASKLAIGQAQYACMPNDTGGIVDDLLVYRLPEDYCSEGEQAFMLVVNASNIQKDWDWIQATAGRFDARLIDISDETALLAVQGPLATAALQSLCDIDLAAIPYYHFQKGTMAGIGNVLISATGYTGAGGFELYVRATEAKRLWDAVMAAGAAQGIRPIGLGARDTLRMEMGFCLYGNDIDDSTSPMEAGLGWITKLNKAADFPGKALFAQQKTEGLGRRLVGLLPADRRVPRQGYAIENEAGETIGHITSGTHSPSLDRPIGMGYVATAHAAPGSQVFISLRNKRIPAEVVKFPFLNP